MTRTARVTINVLVAALVLAAAMTLLVVERSPRGGTLVRVVSHEPFAQSPSSDVSARLAVAGFELSTLTQSQQGQVAASTFTADKALSRAKSQQPKGRSFDVYLGSFTDFQLLRAASPSESGPPVFADIPAYLVVVQGATVFTHGPRPKTGVSTEPATRIMDIAIAYDAMTGEFVAQTTL